MNSEVSVWAFFHAARPAEEEAGFRAHYLQDDSRQMTALTAFVLVFMLVLSLLDVVRSDGFMPDGFLIRAAFIVFGIGMLWIIHRFRHPRVIDFCALGYTAFITAGVLYYHASGGASVERVVAVVTLYIYVAHLAFPTYTVFISPAVAAVVAGEAYLLTDAQSPVYTSESGVILVVLVSSLVIAAFASALLQRSRYNAYRAMKQVRTLSGLIPICASCKKVRDDDGFYMQVEQYIRDHSNAEFTHGLCPDCARATLEESHA